MQDPIETVEFEDIPDDASELDPPEGTQYHTLLEVWRALLKPAREGGMRDDPITPQWATKIVSTYQQVTYQMTPEVHARLFELVDALAQILDAEIETDDECLKHTSAEEDRTENSQHYLNLLRDWQVYLLRMELAWNPVHDNAAIELAALSEVHNMFLGQNGLVGHLESIQFQFTEDDQQALQEALIAVREGNHE